MVKYELTSAYHSIEIYDPHTQYLSFPWSNKRQNLVFYKCKVLSFGLSCTCSVFTQITRPLIATYGVVGKVNYYISWWRRRLYVWFQFKWRIRLENHNRSIANATKSVVGARSKNGISGSYALSMIYIPDIRMDEEAEIFTTICITVSLRYNSRVCLKGCLAVTHNATPDHHPSKASHSSLQSALLWLRIVCAETPYRTV